jgi:hypothetical protein
MVESIKAPALLVVAKIAFVCGQSKAMVDVTGVGNVNNRATLFNISRSSEE